ncbi:ribosomal protein uL16 3-hydroxylase [Paludibacterium paludis]|nr:cupin domain-containing protein [Paludibacterium paludis]
MTPHPLLGGLTPAEFLRDYWQKKPLLIRGAMTDVGPHIDRDWLFRLAGEQDVESRLIERQGERWKLERGPFRASRFKRLPETDWTVLVQSVNHHVPHIDRILWQFDFIPYARLDDLMISFAPPGGTVGPHFDSYDVFLLQVGGKKRWQISSQDDTRLVEGAPLRILENFDAEETFDLEHGDMLYLPPRYAHYGVAQEPGMTYSIGFRAPTAQELAGQFLVHLQDRIELEGMYADPDLTVSPEPARLRGDMVEKVSAMLRKITWNDDTIADFLGHYLTEPKAHVFYDPPEEPMDRDTFATYCGENALVLDPRSLILYTNDMLYCNGEQLEIDRKDVGLWQQFANARRLVCPAFSEETLDLLYDGYVSGYWLFESSVAQ